MYHPLISPVTLKVWRYSAVVGFSNTVSFPSLTVVESLVQVTVVAVSQSVSVKPPDTDTSPVTEVNRIISV